MRRLQHFIANVGWSGLLRSGIVTTLLAAMCVMYLRDRGSPAPAFGLVLGVMIPMLGRGWLTDDPDRTLQGQRVLSVGIVATSVLGSLFKDELMASVSEPLLLFVLTFVVMLYIGSYWFFWADPEIFHGRRLEEE